jgi:hypothetical protein
MSNIHTPEQRARWVALQKQIGQQLRNYYQACATNQLPQQLLTVLKKLDQELPEEQDQ